MLLTPATCHSSRGALLFVGAFDVRDVEIAARAYPGRSVSVHEKGLWVGPGRPG